MNVAQGATLGTLKMSVGQNCIPPLEDGRWRQTGGDLGWYSNRCHEQKAIGIGGNLIASWLDWTAEYVDRGTYSGGGVFTSDANYLGRAFIPMYSNHYQGSAKALVLTLDPTYRIGPFDLFGRIGGEAYRADLTFHTVKTGHTEVEVGHRHKEDVSLYLGYGVRFRVGNFAVFAETYKVNENVDENPTRVKQKRYGNKAGVEFRF